MIKEINSQGYAVKYKYNEAGWILQKLKSKTRHNKTNKTLHKFNRFLFLIDILYNRSVEQKYNISIKGVFLC